MELSAILQITYELCRKKQDQDAMFYEDQLSFMLRKYENLKEKFNQCNRDYSNLLDQVRELVTKKLEKTTVPQPTVQSPVKTLSPTKQIIPLKRKHHLQEDENKKQQLIAKTLQETSDELFIDDFFASPTKKSSRNTRPVTDQRMRGNEPNKRQKTETTPIQTSKQSTDPERTVVSKYIAARDIEDSYTPEFQEIKRKPSEEPHIMITTATTSSPVVSTSSRSRNEISDKHIPAMRLDEREEKKVTKESKNTKPPKKSSNPIKYVETIRKKDEREGLRGFQCAECAAFYNAQMKQGIFDQSKMNEFLKNCSRHKGKWTPPDTPEGFWDLTIRTPEDWKN